MNRSRLKHFLMESGVCLDRAELLDWIIKHPKWRIPAFRFLRLRFSPEILLDAKRLNAPLDEKGRLFSLAISYINVRDTYKTTGMNRTVLADREILGITERNGQGSLLEIGVSDGSSSLGLIQEKKAFSSITLSDRYNVFYRKKIPFGSIFLDSDKKLLGVKFLGLYFSTPSERVMDSKDFEIIETLNPSVANEEDISSILLFDIFTDSLETKVDIIKCANILNSSYFSDSQLSQIIKNLRNSLSEGGHIVVSQNNQKYEQGEAVAIYKKKQDSLILIKDINNHDLVEILGGHII